MTEPSVELSIIIINWNSRDYVRKCLRSVHESTRDLSFEILVVDNASYDGCREMLAKEFPGVRFIQCEKNIGFARANNLAFEQTRGACILCLNPDTEVMGPAINQMHEALTRLKHAGAVGAKLLNTDGTVQTSCIQAFPTVLNQLLDAEVLRRLFPRSPLWGTTALFSNSSDPVEVEAIAGACVMFKREVYQRVRGFEESYFMYAEDIDLSFKVREAGLKRFLMPKATVIHHGGRSSTSAGNNFSTVMMRESVLRFMRLRRGRLSAIVFRAALGGVALLRLPLAAGYTLVTDKGTLATAASIRKWLSILRWSLGMEGWVRNVQTTQK